MLRKILDDQVSISDQISNDDLSELAKLGVEILVCNRPDGESEQQEAFSTIEKLAQSYGIKTAHIPFRSGEMCDVHCSAFMDLMHSGKKIHAYCRTGYRSTMLWASFQMMNGTPKAEILSNAKNVGFDISKVLGLKVES